MSDRNPEEKIRQLMREAIPESSKVIDFATAARKRGRSAPQAKPVTTPKIEIRGNNNAGVVGNSNHIQINVRGPARPKIQVTPGDEEVTNEQASEIKRLVSKVVEVSGRTFPQVYGVIYRRFNTTSYQMIKRHKYDDVVAYLRKWIASNTSPVESADPDAQRKQLLKRIHAQARKTSGEIEKVHSFTQGRFSTPSLAELTPGQLREVIKQFGM